jgi:hypothetical protein
MVSYRKKGERGKKETHPIVPNLRSQLRQQPPSLLHKRSKVSALSERIQIPQRIQLRDLADLRLGRLKVSRLFVFVVLVRGREVSGRSVVEVLEEEGHELGETVFEELGEVLRVEVVVELEKKEEGLEEEGVLVGSEGGGVGEERVGLLSEKKGELDAGRRGALREGRT